MKPHPYKGAGSRQDQRTAPGLPPETVDLFGYDDATLVAFLKAYAADVRFYGPTAAAGDRWGSFFEDLDPDELAAKNDDGRAHPHRALLIAFLRLYQDLGPHLNAVVGKHLDYYYGRVLGTRPRQAEPDRAHLLVEPTRNATAIALTTENEVRAEEVRFRPLHDTTITQARVTRLHQLFSPRGDVPRYATIADSIDGLGEPLGEDQTLWRTFGGEHLPVAPLGFAVASPTLAASQGRRTLGVELKLDYPAPIPGDFEDLDLTADFRAWLSGAEGWLGPFSTEDGRLSVSFGRDPDDGRSRWRLRVDVALGVEDDPVTLYDPQTLEGGFDTVSPVLKIELSDEPRPLTFDVLRDAHVAELQVVADVEGMTDLVMENDHGRIDPAKPFMPFGPAPRAGASWYVGSSEVFGKNVSNFKLSMTWADVPENLGDYYSGYSVLERMSRTQFTARVTLHQDGSSDRGSTSTLFAAEGNEWTIDSEVGGRASGHYRNILKHYARPVASARWLLPSGVFRAAAPLRTSPRFTRFGPRARPVVLRRADVTRRSRASALLQEGYIRICLDQGFGHDQFAHLYARTAIRQSRNRNVTYTPPNPPYTPLLQKASLDYHAETLWIDLRAEASEQRDAQFFQLVPFGQAEQHGAIKREVPHARPDRIPLLADTQPEGQLFIGLSNAEPGEGVNLLFQLASESADPEIEPPEVSWSVLAYNEWLPIERPVRDTTLHLRRPGIVSINLPPQINDDNSLMGPGLVWLRATVARHAVGMAQTERVAAQALVAERVLESPDQSFEPLPAGSLGKLAHEVRGVKGIAQPFASFGHTEAESPTAWYTRVSERLRHRQRALTVWDYERLVLDAFPEIYGAKCVPHLDPQGRLRAGHVTVVVIPARTAAPGAVRREALAPKADLDTLARIQAYLSERAPAAARVVVMNPVYEPVRIEAEVRFHPHVSFADGERRVTEALDRLLSPWAFASDRRPEFGVTLYLSEIVALLDRHVDVDVVREVKLRLVNDPGTEQRDRQFIRPDDERAILISGPHELRPFGTGTT